MSLQRKLVISFCVFLLVLFIVMAVILFFYGTDEIETRAEENMQVIGEQMVQHFDNLIRPMDFITVNLISTDNFINSMSSLSNIPRDTPGNDVHINRAMRFIYTALINDSINRNFYGISVFNERGDLFSSRTQLPGIRVPVDTIFESFPWIARVNELQGRTMLIPPRANPWNESNRAEVFSLVRALYGSGGRVGYIEVQHDVGELDNIFSVSDSLGLRVILLSNDGEVFYHSGFASGDSDEVYEFARFDADAARERDFLFLSRESRYTGFELMLFQDRQMLLQPLTNIMRLGGIMMLVFLTVSVLFALALYGQIIKPIRILRRQMESVELETLQNTLSTATTHNDLVTLENTFNTMRMRLSEAITRQLRSQELQMQANYDVLQLQINPHFLYNVLHVLSQKGLDSNNNEICEICSDLASMMRYSTSTLHRTATIREELNHVEAYLSLMQKRYESRISFTISPNEGILSCELPKITLQQFVENSIKHSFDTGYKEITIDIKCIENDDGWGICVSDNGPGFSEEVLLRLKTEMPAIREKLVNKNTEFAIGGMGLLNTYARLWLYFGDSVEFTPGNNENGGAYVMLTTKHRKSGEQE